MFLIQCMKNWASKPGLLQEVWLISFGRPVVFLKAWMHFQTRETGNKVKMAAENTVTSSLDRFSELKEVTTLIESIRAICHDDILLEAAEERLTG